MAKAKKPPGRPTVRRDRIAIGRDLKVLRHMRESLVTHSNDAMGALVVRKIDELVEAIRVFTVAA